MFVSHHTLKWTRTCRSHGRHPHAHTAHFLLNRHIREAPVGHAHVGDVATCGRFGAPASNLRSIRSGLPSVPFAGLVATGVFPRLTPRMPSPRMMFITWSRPTSAGSQPCANNWAWTFLYPYTAMRKSEWISRMSRAKASWRATSGLAAGS